ncbi:hypothetical protein L218DRAFT_986424 [Marasmius fiardii PR-910]|nr:hypothetical protein L218DRAFT_986424 [Marasmius fiardii PR-910]
MAPPKSKQKPQNHPDGEQCEQCGAIIARRGDMPRHKRIHAEAAERNAMLHKCSWEGCNYSSLQRPNVDTHYRTHTKERNQACPDCDSKFSDPGSLIRHRKNLHGYVPKPRKKRITTAAPEQSSSTRGSQRHQPYSRSPSTSSSSSPEPTTPPATDDNVATTTGTSTNNPTTAFPVIFNPDYGYAAMQSITFSKPPSLPCSYDYSGKEDDPRLGINPYLVSSHWNHYFWEFQDRGADVDEFITRRSSQQTSFPAYMEQPPILYPSWDWEYSSWIMMHQGDGSGMEEWKKQSQALPAFSGEEVVLSEEGVEASGSSVHGPEEEKRFWDSFTNQPNSSSSPAVDVSGFLDPPSIAPLPSEADSVHVYYDSISQSAQSVTPPSSTSLSPYNLDFDYRQTGSGTPEASITFDQLESAGIYASAGLESFPGPDLTSNLGVIPDCNFGVDSWITCWPPVLDQVPSFQDSTSSEVEVILTL